MFSPRSQSLLFTILSAAALVLFSPCATAQAQFQYEPATSGFTTELKVWTSGGNTYAKVRLTFPNTGYRVSDWGQATASGNQFVADAKVERCLCGSGQAITIKENNYSLGSLPAGTYSFTFRSYGVTIKTQQFDPSQVVEHWEPATLPFNGAGVRIWNTGSATFIKIEFYFPDTGYRVTDWGQAARSGNQFTIDAKADQWTGDSVANTTVLDHDYNLGTLAQGQYTLVIKVHGTTVRTLAFSVLTAPAAPRLLTEEDSGRAIALDSVTWMRLFPLVSAHNFSDDRRTRIMLFAAGADLAQGETSSVVTAQAVDAQQKVHQLSVEYVGKVPGYDWLTQIIVRPPDELKDGGDVSVSISVRGVSSNSALITIKPSAQQ